MISLKRTPRRLKGFFDRNAHALEHFNVHILEGLDGTQHKELFKQTRLISQNVLNGWSPGAIGSALSHMLSWRRCIKLGKPMIIVEDDAILAANLWENLQGLLRAGSDLPTFLLLGWNLDSLLQAELEPGLGLISLLNRPIPRRQS